MIILSAVEQKALDALLMVREHLAAGAPKLKSLDQMALMALVRDAITALDNKRYGCPMGLHQSTCTCTKGIAGKASQTGR